MSESPPSRLVGLVTEGVVIVVSILLAFAIDAWWDERQERVRVTGQLDQVSIDLRSTLANLDSYGGTHELSRAANRRLVEARNDPGSLPVDSVGALFVRSWIVAGAEPRFESVRSLVETGDIALLEDSELQGAMTIYLARVQETDRYENELLRVFGQTAELLFDHIDLTDAVTASARVAGLDEMGLAWDAHSAEYAASLDTRQLNRDAQALVGDDEVQRILSRMLRIKTDVRFQQRQMRDEATALLTLVEAARDG